MNKIIGKLKFESKCQVLLERLKELKKSGKTLGKQGKTVAIRRKKKVRSLKKSEDQPPSYTFGLNSLILVIKVNYIAKKNFIALKFTVGNLLYCPR